MGTIAYPQTVAAGRPWYRHRWPWLLMLGPLTVLLAGAYTGWLAWRQPDALVAGDYYKQGKAINQNLSRERAAASLGLSLKLHYEPAQSILRGQLLSYGKPISGGVRLRLIHPTRPERDVVLEAQPDRSGEFAVPLGELERARWQLQMENQQRSWRLSGDWTWPKEQAVVIAGESAPEPN